MIKLIHFKKLAGITLISVVMLLTGTTDLFAQAKIVSGTVKDETGSPIPGVSIIVKGTANGTVTDADGKFSLNAAEGTLVFSSIGMVTKEMKVENQTSLDISMVTDVTQLTEVVVIGYGEVERKDLTSSVSSINAKQLKDIPMNSAAQALSGRLAGVQVVAAEGSPNAQVQIRVRGGGSITQDNSPLYVVDGVQVENALNVLSPQDIASIDVLKDASATAIYGARGANGVVIITTKGGRKMKPLVTYNGLVGFRKLANELEVMNPYDFVMYQYERSRGGTATENTFRDTYGNFSDLDLYKGVPNVNWQQESFGRTAVMQTHNVGVQGGTDATQYNVSLSSNKEEGVQVGSDFNRTLANLKLDQRITSFLRAGVAFRYNNTVVNGAGTSTAGSSSTNRLRQSVKYRPILFPGQDPDTYDPAYAQETNGNSLALVNPLLLAKAEYQKDISNVMNISGNITLDPTKYLTFRSTLGYDLSHQQTRVFNDTITNYAKQTGQGKPTAAIDSLTRSILNNSNVLTFTLQKLSDSFAKHNKLDLLIGQELYETKSKTMFNETHGYKSGIDAVTALDNMSNYSDFGTTPYVIKQAGRELTSHLLSFFTRANFSRDDKYMATVTMRADGSSKFAVGHQWGYFPSASVAWRISNESFFKGVQSAIRANDLKFRVSFGQSGNNRIDDFLYLTQFELYLPYDLNNSLETGYGAKSLANSNLKWETTISRNLGVDMSFFESRLQLTVDVYKNSTKDLLVNTPVPTSSGYSNQLQNIGSTSNRGVELQLSATAIQTDNFSWKPSFNISFNKNKVESLGRQQSFLVNSGWGGSAAPSDYSVAVGKPTGTIWGLIADGYYGIDDFNYSNGVYTLKAGIANNKNVTSIDPRPGIIKYQDISGPNGVPDGIVDDKDRTSLGTANPKFFGGLNNQFTYKNFDMSVFVNFQYGNKVLNANKLEFSSGYTPNSNLLAIMNNRFTNVNAEGQVVTDPDALRALNADATLWTPLTTASSFYVNSWAIEDGSFLRINNVTVGYTFPALALGKLKISKLRLYATGNNLAVFTKYSGYDPEVNTRRGTPMTPGVDYSAYPRSHNYIFGLNLAF